MTETVNDSKTKSQDLPVYLLMTGLYENVSALQNEKSLTFLYRTPKIHLGPLNIGTIAEDYRSVLGLNEQEGLALAKLTKGYSFAFQVLGYFAWENASNKQKAQQLSRQYLDEHAYDKVGPNSRAEPESRDGLQNLRGYFGQGFAKTNEIGNLQGFAADARVHTRHLEQLRQSRSRRRTHTTPASKIGLA